MWRIDRYILREFATFFAIALGATVFLSVLNDLMKLGDFILKSRLGWLEVLRLFTYIFATLVGMVLPIAYFLASILTWNRFSSDSEYIVWRTSGFSLYRLLAPLCLVAILVGAASSVTLMYGRPWGLLGMRHMVFEAAYRQVYHHLKPGVFHDAFRGLVLYVKRVNSEAQRLEELFIASTGPDVSQVIVAPVGELIAEPESRRVILRLHDGAIHRATPTSNRYQVLRFERYDVHLDLNTEYARKARRNLRPTELYPEQLWAEIRRRRAAGEEARKLVLVWYRTFAYPCVSLIFAGLGPVLGVVHTRSGRAGGYVLGLLGLFVYYLFMAFSTAFGEATAVSPLLATWIPNLCLGGLTLLLVRRASRQGTVFPEGWSAWSVVFGKWRHT
jgi:lipopolysaccharide export system permease protein